MNENVETFPLRRPVTITFNAGQANERSETIERLEMRSVSKARDLRVVDGHEGEVAKAIALIAHLSGQPIRVIDELDPEDFAVLARKVNLF